MLCKDAKKNERTRKQMIIQTAIDSFSPSRIEQTLINVILHIYHITTTTGYYNYNNILSYIFVLDREIPKELSD